MTFVATVFQVFLAGPSDVDEEREIIRREIANWNAVHAMHEGVVLLPVGWKASLSPSLGVPAQDQIDAGLLPTCDLMIGVFWNRIGTATGGATSGTLKEILSFANSGKPVALYFSSRVASNEDIDTRQVQAVKKLKASVLKELDDPNVPKGIIDSFKDLDYFARSVRDLLTRNVRQLMQETSIEQDQRHIEIRVMQRFNWWNTSGAGRHHFDRVCPRDLLPLAYRLDWPKQVQLYLLASAIQHCSAVSWWLTKTGTNDEAPELLRGILARSFGAGRRPPLRAAWCAAQLASEDRARVVAQENWPGERVLEPGLKSAILSGSLQQVEDVIADILRFAGFDQAAIDAELRCLGEGYDDSSLIR